MEEKTQLNGKEIKFLKELFETKFDAVEKATSLANETLKTRLEQMNEFRGQMKDQMNTFITRQEIEQRFNYLEADKDKHIAIWLSIGAIIISLILGIIKL